MEVEGAALRAEERTGVGFEDSDGDWSGCLLEEEGECQASRAGTDDGDARWSGGGHYWCFR